MSSKSTKHHKDRPNLSNILFDVDHYDGDGMEIVTETMTKDQFYALDIKSYDCCLAACVGTEGYRNPETGEWTPFNENGKSIGNKIKIILEAIQWEPAIYHSTEMLYTATGDETLLDDANKNSKIMRLRRAFNETKETEHYILTNDIGVAWPKEKTWISVRMIIQNPQDNC